MNVLQFSVFFCFHGYKQNEHHKVVAVSWGPQAKPLVADIACRGTQAAPSGLFGVKMIQELDAFGCFGPKQEATTTCGFEGLPQGHKANLH